MSDNFFIVTGGPGAGKASLITELARRGLHTIPETGRAIICEEMQSGGDALPWADRMAYAEQMLERDLKAEIVAQALGLPDPLRPPCAAPRGHRGQDVPLQPLHLHRTLLGRDLHTGHRTQANPRRSRSDLCRYARDLRCVRIRHHRAAVHRHCKACRIRLQATGYLTVISICRGETAEADKRMVPPTSRCLTLTAPNCLSSTGQNAAVASRVADICCGREIKLAANWWCAGQTCVAALVRL